MLDDFFERETDRSETVNTKQRMQKRTGTANKHFTSTFLSKVYGDDSDSESKSPSPTEDEDESAQCCGLSSPELYLYAWEQQKKEGAESLSSVGVGGGKGTENKREDSCSGTASKAIPESSRTAAEENKKDKIEQYLSNARANLNRSGARKGKTKTRRAKQQAKIEDFCKGYSVPVPEAPYWVYLMSIVEQEHCSQKTLTHVGKARDPVAKVYMHNECLLRSKSTRPASGLWTIELVIGPFSDKKTTEPVREFWKKKRRGPASRRELGKWLASTLGLECYDARYGDEDDYAEKWNESRKKRAMIRRQNRRPRKRKKASSKQQ